MGHLRPFYIALYIVFSTFTDNFTDQTQEICWFYTEQVFLVVEW